MTIYIDNHPFHYETENLVRLFFPNEKLTVSHELPENPEPPYVITSAEMDIPNGISHVGAQVCIDGQTLRDEQKITLTENDKEKQTEREMAVCLYRLLCRITGKEQPWGILTGVRPVKLFRRLEDEHGEEYAKDYFRSRLLVSPEKTDLCALTEAHERKILQMSREDSYSLYVSIPFCPSRCSYCSFVSQTVEKAGKLMDNYFDLLCKELEHTAKLAAGAGLRLESVYIGGGTPTTLSAVQLSGLIAAIRKSFDMSACREFTVEAGRPDTIDEDKLRAILDGGADRISINPQTLDDDVLRVIGRRHSAEQTIEAFELARRIGLGHINMDLIAGLPTDTVPGFTKTLDRICDLNPESVTVHTLALKRSSRLNLEGRGVNTENGDNAAGMLTYCKEKLTGCGYHPYYLYRQTRMEGNLENVGWSRDGFDGIYNVFVMDETHTILGCGAGAVTKLKDPNSEQLERIFNYKYPYEYISGFEEMLKRKERVKEFYDKLS